MTKWQHPLILASSSPRRVALLKEGGIESITHPPELDDGIFTCGTMKVDDWVKSLAMLKAQHVQETYASDIGTILAADTVCVVDGNILGQPLDADDASGMIRSMRNRSHEVYTGWCLVSADGQYAFCDCEIAEISIGEIQDDEIELYVASNQWQGKAGGYNLSEQVAAGWPITCKGDPTSVMGLPMERLKQELHWDPC